MTRSSPPQVAFSAGEIDPLLSGRFDYQKYQAGLARCHGFLPLPQGGVTRAPGTTRIGQPRGATADCVLVPFLFAANDAVVLEFTPGWMRVWRYGVLVLKPDLSGPYELAVPFEAQDLQSLRWVQSADVIYMVDGRHPVQRLSRFALNNWTIGDQLFETGPFRVQNLDKDKSITASDTTGTITLTSDFDIFTADHVGSLMQLSPTDNSTIPLWTSNEDLRKIRGLFDGVLGTAGTWGEEDTPTDRVLRRYGNNVYECTQGNNSGTNPPIHTEGEVLVDNKPTKWLYLNDDIGIVRITAVTDARTATATVLRALSIAVVASPTYRWSEGAWSEVYGYPSAIELFEQRLCFAATPSEPRTIWFSTVGAYSDFLPSTEPDGAFAYTLAGSESQNRVTGLRRGRAGLHIFALSEEYSSRAESRTSVIGPTNAVFSLDGSSGARDGRAIAPNGDPMFVSRDGSRLIMVRYDLQSDANREINLSRASQHLGLEGFARIVWQQTPDPRAWILRDSGDLAVMIFDQSEEILGWATHSVGAGRILDLCVTQNADGTEDNVWLLVERDLGGAQVVQIEYLDFGHHLHGAKRETVGAEDDPIAEITVPWLEGETVTVWTPEEQYVAVVPVGGTLDLLTPSRDVVVGLFVDGHQFQTLDLQAAAPDGNAMGRQKRLLGRLAVRVHMSAGGQVQVISGFARGMVGAGAVGRAHALIDRPVASDEQFLFTGVLTIPVPAQSAKEVALLFTPDGNRPLTVLAITPTIQEAGE